MTHARRFVFIAGLVFWASSSIANELDRSLSAYAKANNDYYQAIRNGNHDAKTLNQMQQQYTGAALQDHQRAYESTMKQSMDKYGLVPGSVRETPGGAGGKLANTGKRWVPMNPSSVVKNSKHSDREVLEEPAAAVREEDRHAVRYDRTGIGQTVKFGGDSATGATSAPKRSDLQRTPAAVDAQGQVLFNSIK